MSYKLNPEGKFVPFKGWTIISPVKKPALPQASSALDTSQSVWHKLLVSALELIRTSECSRNFAILPSDSMHMTITGLTEEVGGAKPADLENAPWDEVEAALIKRVVPFLSETSGLCTDLEVVFSRVIVSTIICIELETVTKKMSEDIKKLKDQVLAAAGLPKKSSHWLHITLAYRTCHAGDLSSKESELAKKIASLFETGSPANWKAPALKLLPPYLACFPDMTEFPSRPLYPMNQPLSLLLDNINGAPFTSTDSRKKPFWGSHIISPTPATSSSTLSKQLAQDSYNAANTSKLPCAIAILGRGLEDGKVTKTLENRLCRGYQSYIEAKESSRYAKVFLILCGGFTSLGLEISEASEMKLWLQSRFDNIPDEDLILEDLSMSTVENALYVRRILLENPALTSLESLAVVTSISHIGRSTFIFTSLLRRLPGALNDMTLSFISCKDADPSDEAIELVKASDWAGLLRRSLAFTSSFSHSSPLEMAKRNRLEELVRVLSAPASKVVDAIVDNLGNTVLHVAVQFQRIRVINELLRHGSNVTTLNKANRTPLDVALSTANLDIISLLLSHTASLRNGRDILSSISVEGYAGKTLASTSALYMLVDGYMTKKSSLFLLQTTEGYREALVELETLISTHSIRLRQKHLLILRLASRQNTTVVERLISSSGLCHPSTSSLEMKTLEELVDATTKHLKTHPKAVVVLVHEEEIAKQLNKIIHDLSSSAQASSSANSFSLHRCIL